MTNPQNVKEILTMELKVLMQGRIKIFSSRQHILKLTKLTFTSENVLWWWKQNLNVINTIIIIAKCQKLKFLLESIWGPIKTIIPPVSGW